VTLTMQEKRDEFLLRLGYVPMMGGAPDDDPEPEEEEEETPPAKSGKKDTYTAAEVEAITRERLRRQRDSLKAKQDADLDQRLAEMKAESDKDLKAQLDLAKQKLEKFDGLVAIVDKYTELADAQYEAEFATLPEALQVMAPESDADPFTKQQWLTGALKAAKLMTKEESKDGDTTDAKADPKKPAKPGFNPKDPKMKKGEQERLDTILARFRGTAHFDTM